jgi:tRNA-Thr(GGU) m(6)t(6)A37 methyltransferase TsaA
MDTITYHPIGIIHTPFKTPEGTPIQPPGGVDDCAVVEVFPEYREGLRDIEGFSHLILIYHCHRAGKARLTVKPFLDHDEHGLFATRAPSRPNPIGLSVVRLLRVDGSSLFIREVDIVDGTPLLDIKPYVPKFDTRAVERTGWLERQAHRSEEARDDGRFCDP